METIQFVSRAIALALHDNQIEVFGGKPGIRDEGLFEAALAVPQSMFNGQYLHEDLIAMAGAYLFHLAKNHAFMDGNKRVAFVVMLYFLDRHDLRLNMTHPQAIDFVLAVASSQMSKDDAIALLRKHVVPV